MTFAIVAPRTGATLRRGGGAHACTQNRTHGHREQGATQFDDGPLAHRKGREGRCRADLVAKLISAAPPRSRNLAEAARRRSARIAGRGGLLIAEPDAKLRRTMAAGRFIGEFRNGWARVASKANHAFEEFTPL